MCREKPKTLSLWHALCQQSRHSTYLASAVDAALPALLTLLEDRPGTKTIKSIGCEYEYVQAVQCAQGTTQNQVAVMDYFMC